MPPPLPAGLCGGSASGKTTVATRIIEALDVPWVVLLSMDSFYKVRAGGLGVRCGTERCRCSRLQGSGAALSGAAVPVPVSAGIRRSAGWCWCPGPGIRHGAERCRCLQVLDEGQQALAARSDYNFDHPDAFDFELLVSVLRKLKKGKSVKVPVYDFTTHSRRREWVGAAGPG